MAEFSLKMFSNQLFGSKEHERKVFLSFALIKIGFNYFYITVSVSNIYDTTDVIKDMSVVCVCFYMLVSYPKPTGLAGEQYAASLQ